MKNPVEVLRMKEKQIEKIKQEIEALRTVARILADDQAQPSPKKLAQVVQLP